MTKDVMLAELASMEEFFNRSTASLEESDSAFAPREGMFTAAAQIAHVAHTVDWFFEGAFRAAGFSMDWEAMDKQVRAVTSISHARQWFANAIARARDAVAAHPESAWAEPLPPGPIMGGVPRFAIIGAAMDHTAHHRGSLAVYARLCGKVPPMPYA